MDSFVDVGGVNAMGGLQRFVDAQRDTYAAALGEVRAHRKHSHWMWFVFPQLAGLGRSPTAQLFAIGSLEEAIAYLAHPILGSRVREISNATLTIPRHRTAEDVFGPIDAVKLRSSMTLFAVAAPDEHVFQEVLRRFFDGRPDPRTLRLLGLA